ncbi:MAG: hypothetical protein K2X87_04935 [Gemmataceae bacterium]|nr:hypothetical protein [Gemmataceae bacterium]
MTRTVRRCAWCSVAVLLAAAGLLSTPPLKADPSTGVQCPGNYDSNRKYLGCEEPGKKCDYFDEYGKCQDAPGGTACTCAP